MDYEIVQNIIKGDTDKFNLLIDKYYNEIFKFAYNQVNDMEETKNVTQEIFMRIYNNLKKYNPKKASFRTWIYRIANNYCLNYIRDNYKHKTVDYDINIVSSSEDIIKDLVIQDDAKYILSIMKKNLSNRNYKMLILHFFSDLSQKEIAEVLNLAPKTVRNVISESIKKIRNIVRGEYNDKL